MKKYIIFFSIVSLIITTSIVKSSTRQLEKNIFTLEEEVKILEEKFRKKHNLNFINILKK